MLTRRNCLRLAAIALAGGLPAGTPAAAMPAVQALETAAGIGFWLAEEHAIPLVSVRFAFTGGALHDPTGREGLASLMAALLVEGAGELDSQAFALRVADLGTQLTITGRRDRIAGGIDSLSGRLDQSTALLAAALAEPRFDPAAVELARQQRLAELDAERVEPRRQAFDRWWAETFADPRGRPGSGTAAAVAAIGRDDLRTQHRRLLTRDALRIVVVGDIGPQEAMRLVDGAFAALPRTAADRPAVPLSEPRRLATPVTVELPSAVATVAFGTPVPRVGHADWAPLRVLAQVIGSGDFDSTLMDELRVKRGLVYAVSTSMIADTSVSVLLGGMAMKPEAADEALGVLRQVLARTAAEGPASDQVDAARSHLVGSAPLDVDSGAKLATHLVEASTDGRGADAWAARRAAYRSTTVDDVRRVAAAWLQPDKLNYAIVTPRR